LRRASSRLSPKSNSFLHHQFKFHTCTPQTQNKKKKFYPKRAAHAHTRFAREEEEGRYVEIRAHSLSRARKDDDDNSPPSSFERFVRALLLSPRSSFRTTTPKPPFSLFQKREME
jgi:hypothetical protein